MTKVLVITYYWPPAGGPGVQRWLNFVRYLPEFDLEPIVFVPSNPYYPLRDESLLSKVPPNLICYRQKTREPFLWARLLLGRKAGQFSSGIIKEQGNSFREQLALWIRGNLFIPDARKSWVKPAVRKILEIVQKENISTIVTTGPPHSVHLIGLGVKQQTALKWIADFRDPWTSIGYHGKLMLTRSSQKKHKRMEREVLLSADKIIATSQTTAKEFNQITSQPVRVITNGFDQLNQEAEDKMDRDFSLSFIGSMLAGRNPINLWKTLSQLVREDPGFKENLSIKLIGLVSEEIIKSLEHFQLKEFTTLIPYVSHEDARKFQRRSQVLLLVEIDSEETRGIIPGKLFEYMAAKRPILAIGPMHWEAGQMVNHTESGIYFGYEEESRLKSQLKQWYQEYEMGTLSVHSKSIDDYHRRTLTKKLASELIWE